MLESTLGTQPIQNHRKYQRVRIVILASSLSIPNFFSGTGSFP